MALVRQIRDIFMLTPKHKNNSRNTVCKRVRWKEIVFTWRNLARRNCSELVKKNFQMHVDVLSLTKAPHK